MLKDFYLHMKVIYGKNLFLLILKKQKKWKKRYFAISSKGWLFYFKKYIHYSTFKSIVFLSNSLFNQAFKTYVQGTILLDQTRIEEIKK